MWRGSILLPLASLLTIWHPLQQQTPSPLAPAGDFQGIRTFVGAPHVTDLEKLDADIAVIGVPFDGGTSNRPGARYGPRDIREASLIYAYSRDQGFYNMDTGRTPLKGIRWADIGDVDVRHSDPLGTATRITTAIRAVLARKALPVVLGGDHSISFPVLRAFEVPSLMLVHLDAHLDTYGDGNPDKMGHGGWVLRAAKLPFVTKIVQIGMRGLANDAGGVARARELGSTIITTEEIERRGVEATLAQIPQADHLYVSIDIDVLDPSLAPGTGTVEVGGLTFRQVRDLLAALPAKGRVVGVDVVEVNSFYDATGVTAQTAARLLIDLLGAAVPRK